MSSTTPPVSGGPRMGDPIYFVLYYSEPVPDDPNIIGKSRAGWICWVNEDDGTVDLDYMTARQPNEPDNPPSFIEHKIRVPYDPTGTTLRSWHYPSDVP